MFNYLISKENGMYVVGFYVTYLLISLAVTAWVARTLQKHGHAFLVNAFPGNAEFARPLTRLLVIGTCLTAVGDIVLADRNVDNIFTFRMAAENAASGVGSVLLVLGIALSFDLLVLSRVGRTKA